MFEMSSPLDEDPVSTVAVTVTYGERSEMCLETARRALENKVGKVIVVSNGASQNTLDALEELRIESGSGVDIIALERNRGTAHAFGVGISAAVEFGAMFVWLLDDDNWAESSCLARALDAHANSIQKPGGHTAVVCWRDTDDKHVAVAEGAPVEYTYHRAGVFFGFDFRSRYRSWFSERLDIRSIEDLRLSLPQAPYGGLLVPTAALRDVGGPREDFVLYFDDVDLTRRLVAAGCDLKLEPSAVIRDAGSKWADSRNQAYLVGMIKARDRVKTYYSYRNCFVVDRTHAAEAHKAAYFILNFLIYSLYVLFTTTRLRRFDYFLLYVRACRDGLLGRMGERLALK